MDYEIALIAFRIRSHKPDALNEIREIKRHLSARDGRVVHPNRIERRALINRHGFHSNRCRGHVFMFEEKRRFVFGTIRTADSNILRVIQDIEILENPGV